MNDAKRRVLRTALKLFDLTMLVVSFAFATVLTVYIRQGPSLAQFLSMRIKIRNVVMFLATVILWYVVFLFCGMYRSKRLATRGAQVRDALRATSFSSICLAIIATACSISMVTLQFLFFFWILSSILVSIARLFLQLLLSDVRKRGHNLRYMIILGTNPRAIKFARSIEARPELGLRILGFVDDEWSEIEAFKKSGYVLVSDFRSLPGFLRKAVVDEVVNYLPLQSLYMCSFQVARLCEQHGIIMRSDGDIFGLRKGRSYAEELDGDHFIATNHVGRDAGPFIVKRILDIALSLLLLLLLMPLFIVVAILIKLSSPGPIFFAQFRVGLNKRKFLIYKFRTMVPEAETMLPILKNQNEVSGPVFKIKTDPRITPIGKILRRTSIDELPQLINVLKGDMSLVGPRPLPVRDYEGFNEDWQRRRFSVRPGITCLWQVNGRSAIPFEEWMRLDLQYLDEWSLLLDLKILAQTIPAVLRGSGAV